MYLRQKKSASKKHLNFYWKHNRIAVNLVHARCRNFLFAVGRLQFGAVLMCKFYPTTLRKVCLPRLVENNIFIRAFYSRVSPSPYTLCVFVLNIWDKAGVCVCDRKK